MDSPADTDVRQSREEDDAAPGPGFPVDIDTQFDLQALEMGIDPTGNRELRLEDQGEDHVPDRAGDKLRLDAREQDLATDGMPGKANAAARPEMTPEPGEHADAVVDFGVFDDEGGLWLRPGEDELKGKDSDDDEEERRKERAFEEELATAYAIKLDDLPANGSEAPAKPEHFIPPPTEEEMTINMLIDQDLIRLAEQQDVFTSTTVNRKLEESPHVETIIMEGEFVRSALEAELLAEKKADAGIPNRKLHRPSGAPTAGARASASDDAEFLMDTFVKNKHRIRGGRRKTDPPSYKVIGGVAVLALILAAQVVHAYRDSLATYAAFDKTLGSVYRLFSDPLTPAWDVKGWQFETTRGSTDDLGEVLTISSRVLNSSAKSLPYPLLHVSLTDRWEEIIGSNVLEPNEYLAGTANLGRRVPAGETFTAVVRVEAPSPDATGFKLNVCYREPDRRVRCATEDFKD
jgi:hypothetical protein